MVIERELNLWKTKATAEKHAKKLTEFRRTLGLAPMVAVQLPSKWWTIKKAGTE